MKIFLSSTWKDLRSERDAIESAVQRLGKQYVGMEYFGSRPGTPKTVSLEEVNMSDVYVGVVAFRYGSIDQKTGKSITELEYDRAARRNLPCLIYIKNNDSKVLPKHVDVEPASIKKLKAFKAKLRKNHTVSSFDSPDDLAAKVTADVASLLNGWEPRLSRPSAGLLRTLADFPKGVSGEWAIICGGKRERTPVAAEKDVLAVNGDPRELMWFCSLGLPPKTIIIDDKHDEFIEYLLSEKKYNLIAIGSPASNLYVRRNFTSAVFRYHYDTNDLSEYDSLEKAETTMIEEALERGLPEYEKLRLKRSEKWEELRRFWKASHYTTPSGKCSADTGAVEQRGLISIAAHPFHSSRMAVFAGGSRFISTVAAVRMICDRKGLTKRPLGGIVSVNILKRRRGFDAFSASYGWETRPYTVAQVIRRFKDSINQGKSDLLGYSRIDLQRIISELELLNARRSPTKRRSKGKS